MFLMIGRIEEPVDRIGIEKSCDLGVILQQAGEAAFAVPRRHSISLDCAIGVLAAHAGLGQREQHALRVDERAQ